MAYALQGTEDQSGGDAEAHARDQFGGATEKPEGNPAKRPLVGQLQPKHRCLGTGTTEPRGRRRSGISHFFVGIFLHYLFKKKTIGDIFCFLIVESKK